MKKNMQGFTLIELMIVVAIIAILLVIAIPAYQDYTIRTRVSEGVNLAAAAKLAVSETTLDRGGQIPVTNAAAGYESPTTDFVQSITVGGGGAIAVLLTGDTRLGGAANGTLTFTPNLVLGASGQPTAIEWTCTSTIQAKYLPSACRP
jgi:type IV pilus assembly protein PilA